MVKEYLYQIKRINSKIKLITREIELTTEQLENITPCYEKKEGGSGSRNIQKQEILLCKLVDYKTELDNERIELTRIKSGVMKSIERLTDKDEHCGELIYKRYFENKSWERIATEINFSYAHVHRLHKKALEILGEIIKDDIK